MRPSFKPMKPIPEGGTREVIADLYNQAKGPKEVGFLLELESSQTYKLAGDGTLTLDQAARITRATRATAAAEYLATLAGGQFVPVEPLEEPIADLIARLAKENGEVFQAAVAMLAKGDQTCGVLVSEIDDAIRVLIAARRICTPKEPQ